MTSSSRASTRRFLQDTWSHLRQALRTAPEHAQRDFVARLFGCVLVLLALSAVTARTFFVRFGDGPLPGDAGLAAYVESVMSLRFADSVTVLGASAMLVPAVIAAALIAVRAGRPARAVILATTLVAAKAFTKVGWAFWPRTRPGGVAEGMFIPPAPSFPSGHALQAVVVYGLLAVWWAQATRSRVERVIILVGAALVIGVSGLTRTRLGAHYPSDVWAAFAIGALWIGGAVWADRAFDPGGRARPPGSHRPDDLT